MDETDICLSHPTHVFCDKTQKRYQNLFKESKKRFTLTLTVSSTGEFLPLFFILESSAKNELNYFIKLQMENGFSSHDGWVINNLPGVKESYFLMHKDKGHVITYNSSAWMNGTSMMLYLECIFGKNKHQNNVLLMDKFSVHKLQQVKEKMADLDIQPLYLPPGSTGVAQPLDVFVNFQLKSALKKKFCKKIFDDVQDYRIKTHNNAFNNRKIYDFIVKEQNVLETVLHTIDIFDVEFKTDKFKNGIISTFENIGIIEEKSPGIDLGSLVTDFEMITFDEQKE